MAMDFEQTISTIVTAVIGLACLAVVVSKRANTAGVLAASGSSLANVIGAAVSPITGAQNTGASFPTALPNLMGNGTFGAPN